FQLYDVKKTEGLLIEATLIFVDTLLEKNSTYFLVVSGETYNQKKIEGIKNLETTQTDGIVKLDTGYYILELCRGKANGKASGKWGIRYFKNKKEGKNLIKDCSNAIGGFYGPFFTPSNGLINPPEHTIIECEIEESGEIYHRYVFRGSIPNGLDENLKNKNFKITWEFFFNSAMFRRKYEVDEYETFIDGMPVKNKITVGDEFESGQGSVVFNKFSSYGKTMYREGDLYAKILADSVRKILKYETIENHPELEKYKKEIGTNINEVSWDYFWKMFCSEESLLFPEEIRQHVNKIIPEAHRLTHRSNRINHVEVDSTVEVNLSPEQTIFPIAADKTCESNDQSGYSMVWHTSEIVNRYQIVQRKDSGWVNWGTNGENEYPELKTGSVIKTSYGKFENWEDVADRMEKPVIALLGMAEELSLE
ncbi:MAG: hypothetical protein RSC33_00900, partial [Vagococcus sp.]